MTKRAFWDCYGNLWEIDSAGMCFLLWHHEYGEDYEPLSAKIDFLYSFGLGPLVGVA